MGRKRLSNPLNLPERVYARHGAFYYAHPDGKWEHIGTDVAEARKRSILYADPESQFGTMAYWLDLFLVHCEERTRLERKKGGMSQLTLQDYKKTVIYLKFYFGKMLAHQVKGHDVGEYLEMGLKANRGVRANREKATLSACFTWLRTKPDSGITDNPCIGIRRNRESKRDRYVTHDEYEAVAKIAPRNVVVLLNLIYRTLQRPEDIIEWTPSHIIKKRESDGTVRSHLFRRVLLCYKQSHASGIKSLV